MCKYLQNTIEVALILFYSLRYLCFVVSEPDIRHFGVVNGLVRAVSVPRHSLNDMYILYVSHMMRAITWKSQFKWSLYFFTAYRTSA